MVQKIMIPWSWSLPHPCQHDAYKMVKKIGHSQVMRQKLSFPYLIKYVWQPVDYFKIIRNKLSWECHTQILSWVWFSAQTKLGSPETWKEFG